MGEQTDRLLLEVEFTHRWYRDFLERLRADGYEVRGTPLHERERYRGSEIRRRMLDGESWRHLVPDVVASAIDDIRGVERLKKITASDE